MLHLYADAEAAVGALQLEGAVEVIALPGEGRGIHHAVALGVVLAVGVEAPAVVELKLPHLQVCGGRGTHGPAPRGETVEVSLGIGRVGGEGKEAAVVRRGRGQDDFPR